MSKKSVDREGKEEDATQRGDASLEPKVIMVRANQSSADCFFALVALDDPCGSCGAIGSFDYVTGRPCLDMCGAYVCGDEGEEGEP